MTIIQHKRGTSERWAELNPVLAESEIGYDITLKKAKIGDGVTAWSDLPFIAGGGSAIDAYTKTETDNLLAEKNDKIFDFGKFKVVGNPIITNDGVASEFSAGNYLTSGNAYDFDLSLDKNITIKGGNIFYKTVSSSIGLFRLQYENGGKININQNWTTYKVYIADGTNTLEFATPEFSNSNKRNEFTLEISNDTATIKGIAYNDDGTIITSTRVVDISSIDKTKFGKARIAIGNASWAGTNIKSLDLKTFSITTDSVEVFNGLMESTKPIYDAIATNKTELTTFKTDTSNNFSAVNSALNEKANLSDLSLKQNTLVSGTNIKTINGESVLGEGNLVISGGGGGGASIDDSTTSSTTTWSSEKVNAELTSRDTTISEAQNEIVTMQGDVAALDADVSTLKTTVANHTTSISAINNSVEQLMTSSKYTGGIGIDITNNEVSLITQKSGGADYTLSGSPSIVDNVYVNKRGTSHPFKKFNTLFKVTNGTIFQTKFKVNDTGNSMLFGLFTDESAQYGGLTAYVTPTYVNIGGDMYFADGSATINQDTEYYFEGGVNDNGYLYVKIGSTLGGDDIANHVSGTTYSDTNEYSVIRIGYHTSQDYRLYGSIYLADTSITFPNGTKWVAYAPEVTPAIATNDKLGLVKPDGTTLAVAEDGTISASPIYTLITQLTDRIAALEAEINGGNA